MSYPNSNPNPNPNPTNPILGHNIIAPDTFISQSL